MLVLMALAFLHLWTHAERGWFLGIPTVARGIVYEGTTLGDVLALDERDGRVRWRAALGANPDETYGSPRGVISSIAIAAGTAYAVSGSCEAAAFDALDGARRWQRSICSTARNDDTFASPAVAGSRVLFSIDVIADRPTDIGREIALDASTGAVSWAFSPVRYRGTGGGISGTPAVDSARGIVVVGTGNPTPMSAPPAGADPYTDSVIAIDPRSGHWRWATQLLAHDANDFDVFTAPRLFSIARRGRMIPAVGVTLKNSRYVMLDERSGTILWQRQLVAAKHWMQSIGTPASSGTTIVVPLFHGPSDGALVALDSDDGSVLWRAATNGIYEQPVVWRGIVLVAEATGAIEAFDLRDGRNLGHLSLSSVLYGRGLALDGDTLFVAGRGKLWAYRLKQ
ncbi:MAG: PQQ-binding-like beta-propeller repeat protein [Candidatus Eremiobacteraeota bacterium]|nr:PQQ-binding-like beta-propeller repeat protein [Candidatus Eremiobacteraeota bacterium]